MKETNLLKHVVMYCCPPLVQQVITLTLKVRNTLRLAGLSSWFRENALTLTAHTHTHTHQINDEFNFTSCV